MEAFQAAWDSPIEPIQWSVVKSAANVLRGPHVHLHHDEYIMAIDGCVMVGLRDVRPDSPTNGVSCMIKITGDAPAAVMFPRGLLHGWYFVEDSLHLQAVSRAYCDYHPADNIGCHWSDPELDLPWPCTDPILADRAAEFPPLCETLARLFPKAP